MNPEVPLGARVVEDAVVSPTVRVPSRPGKLLMGVFDAQGDYVDGTVLERSFGEQGEPAPQALFGPPVDAPVAEAVFAGPLYFHFGHFLVESLARAWYLAQHPGLPLVWAGQHDWQTTPLRPWQTEILEVLGIDAPPLVAADPLRVARLHVPDLGYRYDDVFHPEHAAFLARYEGPAQVPGERLWLSRSAITTEAHDLNGALVDRRLRAAGWTVSHPERLRVREQLDLLARAEVVAGEEGSAFHALALLTDVGDKQVRVLRRHGPEHRNMHTVGDARQLRQSFHTLEREVVVEARGRVVSKVSASSAETLDVLGVAVSPAGPRGGDWADPAVARVLTGLAPGRLLDVGATSGAPVRAAPAAVRVAVSQQLREDPRVLEEAGVEVFELGLDQYADLFHGEREPFDVVRVAGRRFKDLLEAFRVSTRLAHDGTVWVLGAGAVAGRAAVAVRALHPGHVVERVLAGRTVVFVVRRRPGAPTDVGEVAAIGDEEVRRRTRWLRPVRLRSLAGAPARPARRPRGGPATSAAPAPRSAGRRSP